MPTFKLYSHRVVLFGFGVLSAAGIVGAALIDPDGSFVYLGLLELGVACATIFLTVVLIDRVLDRRRARDRTEHWKDVRQHSVASLWISIGHISRLAYAAFLTSADRESPDHISVIERLTAGCERQSVGTANAIEKLAGLLRTAAVTLPPGPHLTRRASWWIHHSSRNLDHIRETLIPRLLQATTDHELNRLLMRLDHFGYALQGRLAFAGLGIGQAQRLTGTREAVAALLVEYANVARHLESNYPPDLPLDIGLAIEAAP